MNAKFYLDNVASQILTFSPTFIWLKIQFK